MEALKIVFPYLARHKLRIAVGAIAILIGTTFAVVQPYILRLAIDGLGRHFSIGSLTFDVLLYLGAAAGQSIFLFIQRSTVNRVSRFVEYDLRNDLFTHLQGMDQSFFEGMHTGDLMARLTNDLSAVRQFLGQSLITLLSTGIMLIYVVILMLRISVHLAIIAFIVLPFVSLSIWQVGRSMQRRYRKVQDQFGTISTYAQENFSGVRVIKAFVQEDHEVEAFNRANREYVDRALSYQRVSGIMWPLMTFVMGIATALVLYVGGNEVSAGTITIGEFVQFVAYLAMLTWPMISLGWMLNLYQQGAASAGRIVEVLDRRPRIRDSGRTLPPTTIEGRIEFRNVGVRRDDRWVFRDVSFTVEPGESLAIVGMTGAGKSTLMSLVPRVLEPDEGEVLIDGIDVPASHLPDCARRSATCRRIPSSSRRRSPRTRLSESRTRRANKLTKRWRSHDFRKIWNISPTVSKHWSASGASASRVGRSSEPRWRVRSCATQQS